MVFLKYPFLEKGYDVQNFDKTKKAVPIGQMGSVYNKCLKKSTQNSLY